MGKVTLRGKPLHPSKYLSAADLVDAAGNKQDFTLTIRSIEVEVIETEDGEEQKPMLYFEGAKKAMILNVTNTNTIGEMHGSEADNWKGKRITVYPTKALAFGEMKACIRVRDVMPPDPTAPNGATP